MGLFRRSDDEGLYQGDPQSIYVPSSGAGQQPGVQAQPASPLFDDPPRVAAGGVPTDRPPAPPGTHPAPPPPEPGQAGRVARRAVLVLVAAGTVGGAVYGVDRIRQWIPDTAGPDGGDPDVSTRAPRTTRRTTSKTTTGPVTSTRSGSPSTRAPVTGRLGQVAVLAHAGNRYRVTVENPRRQAGPIWDSGNRPRRGFLILDLAITRIDRADDIRQISWSDWTVQVGDQLVDGELIGGGWVGGDTKTLRLAPGKSAAGTLVFDVRAGAGVLELGTAAGPASGRWSIPAVKAVAAPPAAAVGVSVRSDVGGVPFTAKVQKVTWFGADDPAVGNAMANGGLVMMDVALAWSAGSAWARLHPKGGTWVHSAQWRFTPRAGRADGLTGTAADSRPIGRDLAVLPTETSVAGLIAFDSAPTAGTLTLLDDSGQTVMSWRIPGP
ncbi:MAG: hypothetical protein WKF57_22755 [Nakamurella sp.]